MWRQVAKNPHYAQNPSMSEMAWLHQGSVSDASGWFTQHWLKSSACSKTLPQPLTFL
jgi:hypothetical protein